MSAKGEQARAMSNKETDYDIVIIGAGLLGCFAAKALCEYQVRVAVLEAQEDVCTGVSKANSSIVYAGYDMKPHTMKADMTVRANTNFDSLCDQLGVSFNRCGSLMVAFGPRAYQSLQDKYEQGMHNGVLGMHILKGSEARELEPALSPEVKAALFSSSVGTVMPWDLCIAAAENAAAHGVEFHFDARVVAIHHMHGAYVIEAACGRTVRARAVINCAGIYADKIASLAGFSRVRIALNKAEYLVYDQASSRNLQHVIFHETEGKAKGITAVPCIDGHVIVEGPKEDAINNDYYSVTRKGMRVIANDVARVLPSFSQARIIASFAGARPNPCYVENAAAEESCAEHTEQHAWAAACTKRGKNHVREISNDVIAFKKQGGIHDFCVEYNHRNPSFVSLIGVKTPGLTCAHELGTYAASLVIGCLGDVQKNKSYNPSKRASLRLPSERVMQVCSASEQSVQTCNAHELKQVISPGNHKAARLVCACKGVYEDEIVHAIVMGANTLDGVKRRTGAHMGECQGAGCEIKIARILARELRLPLHEVCKNKSGSRLFFSCSDEETGQ